jgi:hypothetical protein
MGIMKVVGAAIYRAAGERPWAPPSLGALQLAMNIYGPDVFDESRALQSDAYPVVDGDQTRIIVREGLHPRRRHFAIACMVARLELRRIGAWSLHVERALAGYLVAPTEALAIFVNEHGTALPPIARHFVITETCAALRAIEVGADGGVVITPAAIYRPRGELAWVDDATVRRLSQSNTLRFARRCVITDEPGRVALFTRAA